jgi:hypothetical protein
MKIKVNRINSTEEIYMLKDAGVDIFGMSIDKNLKSDKAKMFDSRALSIEALIKIKNETQIPHLSIHINWYYFTNEILEKVINEINPESINVFLPTSSFSSSEDGNYTWFNNTVEMLNRFDQDVIIFGDGFMYDDGGFSLKKEEISKIRNLKFIELNSFTIDNKKQLYIKSKSEWSEYFRNGNVEKKIKQELLGDLIRETVTDEISNLPILIDDKFNNTIDPNQYNVWKSKGISMSLESTKSDIYTKNESGIGLSNIANRFEIEEIIKTTKKIKKHYA